jgi:hypothetical protein
MKTTITALAIAAMAMAISGPVGISYADDGALEQLIPQLATTPAQHQEVATYYRSKAAAASAEAARHREMGKRYIQGNYTSRKLMRDHCDALATSYDALAKQYQDMAAAHAEAAKN